MSILDDETDLIEESEMKVQQSFITRLMEKFPINKPILKTKKERIGFDAFGRPIRKGDWIIFKPKSQGNSFIDGLAFGVIMNICQKNIRVQRRTFYSGWYNNINETHESYISPNNIFKIEDKSQFIQSIDKKELNK